METPVTQITIQPESGEVQVRRHMADRTRGPEATGALFGEDGFTLGDVLDVLNPLQHIPFVSTLYRELTGDTISQGAKLVGNTLLGGPLGLLAGIADSIFETETGKDVGATALAMFKGDTAPTHQLARANVSDAELVEDATEETEKTAKALADAQQKLARINAEAQAEELKFATAEILPPEGKTGYMPSAAQASPDAARQVIDLFGASAAPAIGHKSYQNANMLNYLSQTSLDVAM
jgi:hypothetical protein